MNHSLITFIVTDLVFHLVFLANNISGPRATFGILLCGYRHTAGDQGLEMHWALECSRIPTPPRPHSPNSLRKIFYTQNKFLFSWRSSQEERSSTKEPLNKTNTWKTTLWLPAGGKLLRPSASFYFQNELHNTAGSGFLTAGVQIKLSPDPGLSEKAVEPRAT